MNAKSATKIRSSLRKSGYQSANFAASLITSPQQSHRQFPLSIASEIESNYSLISSKKPNDLRGSLKQIKYKEEPHYKNNGAALRKYIVQGDGQKDFDQSLRNLANRYENNCTTNSHQTQKESPFRMSATQYIKDDISIRSSVKKRNQKNNSQSSGKLRHHSVQKNRVKSIDRKLATEASDYESMFGTSFKNGQARAQISNLRGSVNQSNLSGSNKTFDLRQCLPQLTDTTTNITRMGPDDVYANVEDMDREYFSRPEEAHFTRSDYSPQINETNFLNQDKFQSNKDQRLSRKGIQQQIYYILKKKQNEQIKTMEVQSTNHEKISPRKVTKSNKKVGNEKQQSSNLKHFDGCMQLENEKAKSKTQNSHTNQNINNLESMNKNSSNLMFQNTQKNFSKSGMWSTLLSPTGQSDGIALGYSYLEPSSKDRHRSSSNKSYKLQGYNYKDQSVKIHGDQATKQIIFTIDKKLHDCQERRKIIEGRCKKQKIISPQTLKIDQRPLSPKSLSSFLSPQVESNTPQFSTHIKSFETKCKDTNPQFNDKGETRQESNQQEQVERADVIELLKNTLRKNQKEKELQNFLKENYYSPQSQNDDRNRRDSYAEKDLKKKMSFLNQSKNSQKNMSKSGKKKSSLKSKVRKSHAQKNLKLQDKTSQMFSNFYQNILASVTQEKKSSENQRQGQFAHEIEDINSKVVYLENVRLKKEIEQLKKMMKAQSNNQQELNLNQIQMTDQTQIQDNAYDFYKCLDQNNNQEPFSQQKLLTKDVQGQDNGEAALSVCNYNDQIERSAAEKSQPEDEKSCGKIIQEPIVNQHQRSYSRRPFKSQQSSPSRVERFDNKQAKEIQNQKAIDMTNIVQQNNNNQRIKIQSLLQSKAFEQQSNEDQQYSDKITTTQHINQEIISMSKAIYATQDGSDSMVQSKLYNLGEDKSDLAQSKINVLAQSQDGKLIQDVWKKQGRPQQQSETVDVNSISEYEYIHVNDYVRNQLEQTMFDNKFSPKKSNFILIDEAQQESEASSKLYTEINTEEEKQINNSGVAQVSSGVELDYKIERSQEKIDFMFDLLKQANPLEKSVKVNREEFTRKISTNSGQSSRVESWSVAKSPASTKIKVFSSPFGKRFASTTHHNQSLASSNCGLNLLNMNSARTLQQQQLYNIHHDQSIEQVALEEEQRILKVSPEPKPQISKLNTDISSDPLSAIKIQEQDNHSLKLSQNHKSDQEKLNQLNSSLDNQLVSVSLQSSFQIVPLKVQLSESYQSNTLNHSLNPNNKAADSLQEKIHVNSPVPSLPLPKDDGKKNLLKKYITSNVQSKRQSIFKSSPQKSARERSVSKDTISSSTNFQDKKQNYNQNQVIEKLTKKYSQQEKQSHLTKSTIIQANNKKRQFDDSVAKGEKRKSSQKSKVKQILLNDKPLTEADKSNDSRKANLKSVKQSKLLNQRTLQKDKALQNQRTKEKSLLKGKQSYDNDAKGLETATLDSFALQHKLNQLGQTCTSTSSLVLSSTMKSYPQNLLVDSKAMIRQQERIQSYHEQSLNRRSSNRQSIHDRSSLTPSKQVDCSSLNKRAQGGVFSPSSKYQASQQRSTSKGTGRVEIEEQSQMSNSIALVNGCEFIKDKVKVSLKAKSNPMFEESQMKDLTIASILQVKPNQ